MTSIKNTPTASPPLTDPATETRIAAGVVFYPEGRDAAALGAELAWALDADLIVVAVHPDPLVVLPGAMNWSGLRKESEATLRHTRDDLAPGARLAVETGFSVPRAFERMVLREHRNLLALGSSRHAAQGRVRIGKRTRQLLEHVNCPIAIAPRGWHLPQSRRLGRIGVGYDGSPESADALRYAAGIARAAGATLHVRGVVDDRLPPIAYTGFARVPAFDLEALVDDSVRTVGEEAKVAGRTADPDAETDVARGRPADRLAELASICW